MIYCKLFRAIAQYIYFIKNFIPHIFKTKPQDGIWYLEDFISDKTIPEFFVLIYLCICTSKIKTIKLKQYINYVKYHNESKPFMFV